MSLVGRYGLLALWLAFGPITAYAAQYPGLAPYPGTVPYPWLAAIGTWAFLGLESVAFYLLLRSGRRLGLAMWALVLLGVALLSVFDMPGFLYALAAYQLALAARLAVARVARRATAHSDDSDRGPTAA